MANYAEELAYWYLRLNGFFPLTNYVYHRLPKEEGTGTYNADADILAVMPPNYYETIFSGKEERRLKSDEWLDDYQGKWVGVIAEVKGSRSVSLNDVEKAFSRERLKVAVGRLGLTPRERIDDIVKDFLYTYKWPEDACDFVLIKVLFCMDNANVVYRDSPKWKPITLNEADRFIRRRIQEFPDPKSGGRYFFPGTLFQYIIWSERPSHFDE